MKTLLGRIGVIFVVLLILGCAEVWGANWKFYGESEFGKYYYDLESIDRLSRNLIRVSAKEIASPKAVLDIVDKLGEEYGNLEEVISFYEIDCKTKQFNLLMRVFYSKSHSIIDSFNFSDVAKWDSIIPGSAVGDLSKVVCE